MSRLEEVLARAVSDLDAVGARSRWLASGRLATVRLQPPGASPSGVVLDLLFASSGIEPEIVAEAETPPVTDDLSLLVARTGRRIAVKLLAEDDHLRAQDRVDLASLLANADATEVERARNGVELISARGYYRGRDLTAALARLVAGA